MRDLEKGKFYIKGEKGSLVEDDISAVSLAPSHFRQVLARTKTTALPREDERFQLLICDVQ